MSKIKSCAIAVYSVRMAFFKEKEFGERGKQFPLLFVCKHPVSENTILKVHVLKLPLTENIWRQ